MTTLEQLPVRVDALAVEISQLRTEMRVEFSATHAEIASVTQELTAHMLMQHEDLVSKLALMKEGRSRRPKRR